MTLPKYGFRFWHLCYSILKLERDFDYWFSSSLHQETDTSQVNWRIIQFFQSKPISWTSRKRFCFPCAIKVRELALMEALQVGMFQTWQISNVHYQVHTWSFRIISSSQTAYHQIKIVIYWEVKPRFAVCDWARSFVVLTIRSVVTRRSFRRLKNFMFFAGPKLYFANISSSDNFALDK